MPISFSCNQCGRQYSVKNEHTGRKFRCKECSTPIQVPSSDEEIEEYFDDEWGGSGWSDNPAPSPSAGSLPPKRGKPATSQPKSSKPKKKKKKSNSANVPIGKIIGVTVGLVVGLIAFRIVTDVASEVRSRIAAGKNPTWQNYRHPSLPFSIQLPGQPTPVSQPAGPMTMTGASVDFKTASGGAYGFMCAEIPLSPGQPFNVEAAFKGGKQGMLRQFPNSQLTGETRLSINDTGGHSHPGYKYELDVTISGEAVHYTYHYFIIGKNMVIAFTGVGAKYVSDFQDRSNKFLNSIAVNASIEPL